jgi:hypothetical protein
MEKYEKSCLNPVKVIVENIEFTGRERERDARDLFYKYLY